MPKNITEMAQELAVRYVGSHGITSVEMRQTRGLHIRVVHQNKLHAELRKTIYHEAHPFHVKFVESPLSGGQLVNK
jgi:hypothetical protein